MDLAILVALCACMEGMGALLLFFCVWRLALTKRDGWLREQSMETPPPSACLLPSMSFPSDGTKKKCWEEEGSTLEDAREPVSVYKALMLP